MTKFGSTFIFSKAAIRIWLATSGFSFKKERVFSRPCPKRLSLKENQLPARFTSPVFSPMVRTSPSFDITSPYINSISDSLKGEATLFLTTLIRVLVPTISLSVMRIKSLFRTSMRTLA